MPSRVGWVRHDRAGAVGDVVVEPSPGPDVVDRIGLQLRRQRSDKLMVFYKRHSGHQLFVAQREETPAPL